MVTEITKKELPSKTEMRKIFSKFKLNLDFPVDTVDGSTITDWELHNKVIEMYKSNLLKFIEVIKNNYKGVYVTKPSGYSSSIDVYKVV